MPTLNPAQFMIIIIILISNTIIPVRFVTKGDQDISDYALFLFYVVFPTIVAVK